MLGKVKAQFFSIEPRPDGMYISFRVLAESYFAARQLANDCKVKASEGKDKLALAVDIARNKRSLDQNAFMWALLEEIATVIRSSKDEVYLEMLERYGKFTHIIVQPRAAEAVKREWRLCRELGPVEVNGKPGIQLQCYFGSSTYDTAEMSRLIDGIISEAKELGIDTDVVMAGLTA